MNLFATGRVTIGQALASARGDLVIRCMAEPPGGQMSPLPSLRANSLGVRARHPGAIDRIGVCSLPPLNPLLRGRNQDGGGKEERWLNGQRESDRVLPAGRSRLAYVC